MSEAMSDMAKWQLVKDINAAKYNKLALEAFVDEQQQLIDFTYRLTEHLNEAVAKCQGIFDQRMALELINNAVVPITERIQELQGSSEYLSRAEVSDAKLSLPAGGSIPQMVDANGTDLADLSTADLERLVKETRASCAKWLAERDQLRQKIQNLRTNREELERRRLEGEKHNSLVSRRNELLQLVNKKEDSCETLSKLLCLRRR